MPWRPSDAPRFTEAANTREKREVWAHVANRVLDETGDEARAIREADAAVNKLKKRRFL